MELVFNQIKPQLFFSLAENLLPAGPDQPHHGHCSYDLATFRIRLTNVLVSNSRGSIRLANVLKTSTLCLYIQQPVSRKRLYFGTGSYRIPEMSGL